MYFSNEENIFYKYTMYLIVSDVPIYSSHDLKTRLYSVIYLFIYLFVIVIDDYYYYFIYTLHPVNMD